MLKDRCLWNLSAIFKASGYAISGLQTAFRNERAFFQELVTFFLLLPLLMALPQPLTIKFLVLNSMFLVLVVELINSAIEKTIDYISQDQHPLAKKVKDMASAAVFLSLLLCAIFWGYVLLSCFFAV